MVGAYNPVTYLNTSSNVFAYHHCNEMILDVIVVVQTSLNSSFCSLKRDLTFPSYPESMVTSVAVIHLSIHNDTDSAL